MANPGAELKAGEGGGTDLPDFVLRRANQLFLVGLPQLKGNVNQLYARIRTRTIYNSP